MPVRRVRNPLLAFYSRCGLLHERAGIGNRREKGSGAGVDTCTVAQESDTLTYQRTVRGCCIRPRQECILPRTTKTTREPYTFARSQQLFNPRRTHHPLLPLLAFFYSLVPWSYARVFVPAKASAPPCCPRSPGC